MLTGGGTLQTFFSLGAVGCLIDNGLFENDLITAVSGGALLLLFIDLCYNPIYQYTSKPDWYNKYVRKQLYQVATAKVIPYLVKSGFDLPKTQHYIFKQMPFFNKDYTSETVYPIVEYNYVDYHTTRLSCDHRDIIDIGTNINKPYWWAIRPARCCLPFCNFYNKPTYDAGSVSNIPVSSLLTRYSPKRVITHVGNNILWSPNEDFGRPNKHSGTYFQSTFHIREY